VVSFSDLLGNVTALDEALGSMQGSGKVATGAVKADESLENIIAFVTTRERMWLGAEPTEKSFAPYHAWRNLRLIFSKMRIRLIESPVAGDNPKVADQARDIVARVLSLLSSLASIESDSSTQNSKQLLEGVRRLRSASRRVDMTASPCEEIKEVGEEELAKGLDAMLTTMAAIGQA
jgi:hypothetical protein